jgi:hypothetical protein
VFGDPSENPLGDQRGTVGFTPWEYVEISEEQIKHEVGVRLAAVPGSGLGNLYRG